ncbi:MAG: DUF4347 domain-containing protein, partial [Gammaproteobacteria bacterium]
MNRRRNDKRYSAGPLMAEVEPRVLLSADLPGGLVDSDVLPNGVAPLSDPSVVADIREWSDNDAAVTQTHELVIIDASTPDYEVLLNDLMADRGDGRSFEVVILDADRDGIEQITDLLAERSDLSAVHIISHGSDGSITLGDSVLDYDRLVADAKTIQGWGNAFTEDGDLLIYGCNLAAGADGRAFIDTLGELTRTDVAASIDLTGATTEGGDWDLEYRQGVIETGIAFGTEAQREFAAVLAVPVAVDDPMTYSNYVNSLSPLSYWRLGESSGSSSADDGSLGNAGTYNGALLGQPGALADDTDTAVHFNGSSDYIEIAHDPAYLLDDGTIQFWFNPDTVAGDQFLLSKDSTGFDTGGHLTFELRNGQLAVRLQTDSADNFVTDPGTITAGSWHHVAFTFGSGGMKLYVDGQLVDQNAYTGGLGTTSGGTGNFEPLALGAGTETSDDLLITPLANFYQGYMDEVAIFGGELSLDQVQNLYWLGLNSYEVAEDTPLSISAANGVLANDTDLNGDPLTAVLVTGPANAASFTLNADGSFDYTPSANFNGDDTFTYQASDGSGLSNIATATIRVNPVQDAPTTADNTVVTAIDTDHTFTVADFLFSDADGDSLDKIQITKLETVGALQLSGTDVTLDQEIDAAEIIAGNLKFVPVPGQSGAGYDSFEFRVHDGIEYSAAASVTTLMNATFDADAEGFTYADDTFSTANPAFAAGGLTGGGLFVDLANASTGGPVSGGWSDTFNLAQAETVTVSLQYRMIMSEMYESNEFGEIILEVDGVRYGADTNNSLVHRVGDGNGGAVDDTGWLYAEFEIALGAGIHTITVGAYNNDSTAADEYVEAYFDDINVGVEAHYTMTIDVTTAPFAVDDPVTYSNYVNSLSPLGYWRLDESSGTTVYDETGTNDGTYINGPSLGQGGALADEPAHTAVAFDGSVNDDTGDYIEIADDPSYLIDEGSIQLWFYTADVTQDGYLFSKDASGTVSGGHVQIGVNAASHVIVRLQDTATSYNVESTTALTANEWHHVVFTFGSGGMQLYVDGQLVDTDAYTGGLGTSSGGTGNIEPIVIGASSQTSVSGTANPTNLHFDGRIDEVAMFGAELTAQQIRELYGAALQNYTIYQDTTLNATASGGVLANDYDAEGDPLTAVLVTGPSNAQSFTLNADGSFDYTPVAGFSGTDTFTYRANDGTSNSNLATVTITVEAVVTANAIWISTDSDVAAPGADGLPGGWLQGEVLEFGGVDLAFGPATDGDFSSVIDFDTFALDATDVAALHFVSSDITVGGGADTFDLQKGDVLVSFNQDETILGAYTLSGLDETFEKTDLLVFRPDTVGDFSSGTFYLLLDDVVATNLRGITLVEQDTTVGDANLTAGSFLFTRDDLPFEDVYLFDPTGVGAGTTSGTTSTLIDGSALNIDSGELRGLELIEQATSIGGVILDAGTLLFSLRFDDPDVGGNNLATTQHDIFAVTVTKTGIGTTAGVATMFLDGSDVNLDNNPGQENIYAIAMVSDLVNEPPTVALANTITTFPEDTDTTSAIKVADIVITDDSLGTNNLSLSGADAALFEIVGTELRLIAGAALDFETNPNLDVTVEVDDTTVGATPDDTAPLSISLTNVNEPPVNTVPGAQNTDEDVALVFSSGNGNPISVSDVDVGGNDLRVTLSVDNGTLTLAQITGLTFTIGDGTADVTMTFTGTIADINAALDGLRYDPTPDFNGNSTLTITTSDQGNTGTESVLLDGDANLTTKYTFDVDGTDEIGINDATLNNGAAVVADAERGNVLSIDGIDDYAEVPAAVTDGLSTFSVSFWVNTTESGSNGTYHRNPTLFGMRRGGGSQDLGIYTENGYIGFWSSLSGGDDFFTSTTTQINDGQWHQITVSNDGANISLYVDGVFQASLVSGDTLFNSEFYIGALHDRDNG